MGSIAPGFVKDNCKIPEPLIKQQDEYAQPLASLNELNPEFTKTIEISTDNPTEGNTIFKLLMLRDKFRKTKETSILRELESMKNNPDLRPHAIAILADCYYLNNDTTSSIKLCDLLVNEYKEYFRKVGMLMKFWIYFNQGKYSNALEIVRELAKENPNDEDVKIAIEHITGLNIYGSKKEILYSDSHKDSLIPERFETSNYPNPFNPVTKIKFSLPEDSHVEIKVYDVLGREVAVLLNEEKGAGYHEIKFDANDLPSGVYFYIIKAGKFTDVKKIILLK